MFDRKKIICICMTVLMFLESINNGVTVFGKEPDQLYALSAVLMDADTGRVLFEKDGYTTLCLLFFSSRCWMNQLYQHC